MTQTIVRFVTGEEKGFNATAAGMECNLFVLYKWNRKRRTLESGPTFQSDKVAWARLPNGELVLGRGSVITSAKAAAAFPLL